MASRVTYLGWEGYAAGSDVAVASGTSSGTGALTLAGSETWPPGDCAVFIRWSTTARTTKNHPIYLFSYYHGFKFIPSTDPDRLQSGQHGLMDTYGAAWVSGFSDGANTLVRAGPNGATGFSPSTQYEITHRDFPK